MRAIVAGLVLLVAFLPSSASAQKKGKECDPVPEEFQTGGDATYAECAVDKKARVSRHPRINYSAVPVTGATCLKAVIDLVVDIDGKVVPGSARLVSTNSQVYANELMVVIGQTLFSPAKKGDSLVKQLFRYEGEMQVRVSSSAMPGGARRPPPC